MGFRMRIVRSGHFQMRASIGMRGQRDLEAISPILHSVEGQVFYNYIDHVMDNFSLRPFEPTAMMPNPTVSNPDRETYGGRVLLGADLPQDLELYTGLSLQEDRHTTRRSSHAILRPIGSLPRQWDAEFRNIGWFGELTAHLEDNFRIVGGLRIDGWTARDRRPTVRAGMMGMPLTQPPLTSATRFYPRAFSVMNTIGGPGERRVWGLGMCSGFPTTGSCSIRNQRAR